MIDVIEKRITIFEKVIYAQVTKTDDGIQVLVAGGDKSHIGAVSAADPGGSISTITFPGHRETVIAEKWAGEFYRKYHQPVVVSAGIHYNNISKEKIERILAETDNLLKNLLNEQETATVSSHGQPCIRR